MHINVLDVNNNHPEFEQETYLASLPEDIEIGESYSGKLYMNFSCDIKLLLQ